MATSGGSDSKSSADNMKASYHGRLLESLLAFIIQSNRFLGQVFCSIVE